jgi:hypothetical protein
MAKYLANSSGQITEVQPVTTSSGATDATKIAQLDATGKWDITLMPSGLGVPTVALATSETVAAGDLINIWNDSGTAKARKADCSNGRRAHGYVLSGASSGTTATVYVQDNLTGLSGLTPGAAYYLSTTGGYSTSAPTTAGQISQEVGTAISTTVISFIPKQPITLV